MTAYYNEIDPYAAKWLRNLIDAGHIAHGLVDERSIADVQPDDLLGFTQCHFFAGIGIWSLALRWAGWPDDQPVWTGSCPCQPFSAAGKGAGFDDERHLWPSFHRLIKECRPAIAFGEQVAGRPGVEWLEVVHADLEAVGYKIGSAGLSSAGAGKPHIRQRIYWGASYSGGVRGAGPIEAGSFSQAGPRRPYSAEDMRAILERPFDDGPRLCKPLICRGDHGYSGALDRLRAIGNAIDPDVARNFILCFVAALHALDEESKNETDR